MKINKKSFYNISNLVKLDFTEEEEKKLIKDLNQMINFIETMNKLNTDNVKPMSHIHILDSIYREDLLVDNGEGEETNLNEAKSENGCYVVPRIIE